VDEWLDNFLGEPSRARKILGLFALLGLVVGAGYAELIQVAVLPYAIVGAAVGFVFLYLLKLSVKILIAAAFVGAAGLLIWALIQIGK